MVRVSAQRIPQQKTPTRFSNNKRRQILKLMIGIILDVCGQKREREIVRKKKREGEREREREEDVEIWDLFVWLLAMRFYHSIATITKIDRKTKTILSHANRNE